jgi:tetratricopeptide (TPR) repeat protein/DNA-binding SARP family transcriptional activator
MSDGELLPRVEIRLFGPFGLYADEAAVSLKPQARRLLALLAVHVNEPVSRAAIIEAVWDGGRPDVKSVSNQVQVHIGAIRKALTRAGVRPGAVVFAGAGRYRLLSPPVHCDHDRFSTAVAAAHEALSAGLIAQASQLLSQALRIASGAALEGVDGMLAEAESDRMEEQKLVVLSDRISADLRCERYADLVPELRKLTGTRRTDDRFRIRLMLALHASGRTAEALEVFREGRIIARDEQGMEPGQAVQAVHQAILTGAPVRELLSRFAAFSREDSPAVDLSTPVGSHSLPSSSPVRLASARAGPAALGVGYLPPPDTAAFTGRDAELGRITAAVAGAGGAGGVVAIHAIGGMPGIGKTALAVHAAHRLARRFADRQLFIDLHAHTPGQDPLTPETALAGLLTATGLDPRFLPGDLEGRAGLWRERMAGQRILLVLDNAVSSAQVAPLLPGGGDCLVLVTSRRHLGDLPGMVVPLLLDTLPAGQAVQMFTRLAPRAAADPAGVAQVVTLAGFLPLAVSLLARVFARHPSWTLDDLASDTRAGLLTLTAENSSIAAAFELSYRHLDPAQQRFFTLLSLHPGGTTDSYAAAALTGTSLTDATSILDSLHGEGLLTETGYRRYGMHDLLRRYASDHATALPTGTSGQAVGRLLDYYQHTAAIAQDFLARQTSPSPPPAIPAPPLAAPVLEDAGQALAWARAERDSLLACLDHTTRTGQHAQVTTLTAAVAELLRRDGPWAEALTRHTTAVHAARHLSDQPATASALTNLGTIRRLTGDNSGAAEDLQQALDIYRNLGDQPGQASALTSLGTVRRATGDYPGAAEDLQQALDIYRNLGDQPGQASALNLLGRVRYMKGDFQGAAQILQQALDIYRNLGDRLGQANALTGLGTVRRLTGDYPAADADLQQALDIYRNLGDRLGQAIALSDLGTVRRASGDYPGAADYQEQALAICHDIGDRVGQAKALSDLGIVRRATGDYPGAARDLDQALAICHDIGDRGGEVETLNERAALHRLSGDPAQAQTLHQQALELAHTIGSAWDEASALAGLGRCAAATGHTTQATALLSQAHDIFQRIGAADTPAILAELNALMPSPEAEE